MAVVSCNEQNSIIQYRNPGTFNSAGSCGHLWAFPWLSKTFKSCLLTFVLALLEICPDIIIFFTGLFSVFSLHLFVILKLQTWNSARFIKSWPIILHPRRTTENDVATFSSHIVLHLADMKKLQLVPKWNSSKWAAGKSGITSGYFLQG